MSHGKGLQEFPAGPLKLVARDPDYDVIDCVQRTPEWFAARAGRVTSSRVKLLFTEGRKKDEESTQKRDLRVQLAAETLVGESFDDPDEWKGKWVARGKLLEPEARAMYEARFGVMVQQVGFLSHKTLALGSSLDGFVTALTDTVVEFKVPKPAKHWSYILGDKVPAEYEHQVIHHLSLTEARRLHFVSYCPAMPPALRLFVKEVTLPPPETMAWWRGVVTQFLAELDNERGIMTRKADEMEARSRLSAIY